LCARPLPLPAAAAAPADLRAASCVCAVVLVRGLRCVADNTRAANEGGMQDRHCGQVNRRFPASPVPTRPRIGADPTTSAPYAAAGALEHGITRRGRPGGQRRASGPSAPGNAGPL
jgi:hypothetical protein